MGQRPGKSTPRHRYAGPREIDSPGACLYVRFAGRMGEARLQKAEYFIQNIYYVTLHVSAVCDTIKSVPIVNRDV